MNKQLAKITSAKLEIKERGILNFWILVEYEEGCCQGIGGISLDEWSEDKKKRVGTAYGCEMIRRILLELDINDFSEAKNKIIWVLGEGEGFSFKPKGIKSLRVNKKDSEELIFGDVFNEFSV